MINWQTPLCSFVSPPVQKYRDLLLSLWHWHGHGTWHHFLKFYVKVFFMLWERHCQASYPVWGQVLLCPATKSSGVLSYTFQKHMSIWQLPISSVCSITLIPFKIFSWNLIQNKTPLDNDCNLTYIFAELCPFQIFHIKILFTL